MESIALKIKLKPNSLDGVKSWFAHLKERKLEVLETLRNEGVFVESVFLDKESESEMYLIYYMKAENLDYAIEVFKKSILPIDDFHRENKKRYCEESIILEELLDIDRLSELPL